MADFFKKFHQYKAQIPEVSLLLIIILVASFLRLYRIADYMTFLGDEGRDVLVVKRIIVDHTPTLLGPTASVGGFFLGPIYYYFMLPFLWLFRLDPMGPAVMVALFGIVTVFLVYLAGKKFFNQTAGTLAAVLYALSPLVISYSRSSWNPNLMPFFSLLIIFLSWKVIAQNHWSLLPIVGFLFGILFQLHYLATFLFIIVLIFIISGGGKKRITDYLKFLVGFIIGLSPFFLFEIRHNFPNLQTLIKFIFTSEDTGFTGQKFLPTIADVFVRLFSRLVTNNDILLAAIAIGISLSAVMLIFREAKKKNGKAWASFKIIFLWLAIGVLLFGFYRKGIYDYYFGFMFPLPFLLVGLGLSKIYHTHIVGKVFALTIFIVLVSANLKGIPFRFVPNRQLTQAKAVAQSIFDKAQGQPLNIALITGHNSDHAYRYFLEIWDNPPITIENTQKDPERKTVTDQLFVVCEVDDCKPLGHPLWEIAGFGRAEIADSWQVSVIKIYKLIHYQGQKETSP